MKYLLILCLLGVSSLAEAILAGGRPNTFSGGNNAFAGVVNPANAVWIADRFDVGAFWVYQKASQTNEGNGLLPRRKIDLTYRARNILTFDFAIHKQAKLSVCTKEYDTSFSLALYTLPNPVKARTKDPIPPLGNTPVVVTNKTQAISAIFSFKLNKYHSFGISVDYLFFSHRRDGFQNSDNPLRSVSPGNVTNNGTDHSSGVGMTVGWRWNITEYLFFGTAWVRKSYCGQYRRYRGYEPHHAKNFNPQAVGAGFTYLFTPKLAGRLEVLWSNFGNLPAANNNILPDGSLNLNKRGSRKSPGPGLQDATFINMGLGYKFSEAFSTGVGYSHRIRLSQNNNILSHTYRLRTIYDVLTFGTHFKQGRNELFVIVSYGFKNKVSGQVPQQAGGGRRSGERQTVSFSLSWGNTF